jgi:hypothetical protein
MGCTHQAGGPFSCVPLFDPPAVNQDFWLTDSRLSEAFCNSKTLQYAPVKTPHPSLILALFARKFRQIKY